LVAALFALGQSALFKGGQSFEFSHYGEIGRRLSGGEGYRTGVFYPAELAILAEKRKTPVAGPGPVLSRFPLHAILVALSVKVFGPVDGAVLAVQGFELAAAGAAAAFVFFPLLGTLGSILAALLFAASPAVLRGFALWGYPDLLFAALLLAFNEAWLERRSARWLGALGGLCWLARPNFLLFAPIYALHAWKRDSRSEETFLYYGRALIAFLIVVFPFAIYQLFHAGKLLNPNFLWSAVHGILVEQPGWHYFRVFRYSDFELAQLPTLLMKGAAGLGTIASSFPNLWQMGLLMPFALWGIHRSRDARPWFVLNGALLAIQIVAFAFLRQENLGGVAAGRYYLWFAPTIALAALLGARELASRFDYNFDGALPLAAAALLFFGYYYRLPDPGFGHPAGAPRNWPEIKTIRGFGDDSFVVTNVPAHLGWYARKRAVLVPATEEGFERLMRAVPVGSVFLSTLRIGELPAHPFWLSLLRERAAADAFCARHGFRVERAESTGLLLVRDESKRNQ
jgi:hypothetical protein